MDHALTLQLYYYIFIYPKYFLLYLSMLQYTKRIDWTVCKYFILNRTEHEHFIRLKISDDRRCKLTSIDIILYLLKIFLSGFYK